MTKLLEIPPDIKEREYLSLDVRQNKSIIYRHILNNGLISDSLFWHFAIAVTHTFSNSTGYSVQYINLPLCTVLTSIKTH